MGRLEEAETHCRSALATQLSQLGPGHPETAASQQGLGQILTAIGNYDEAETLMLRALEVIRTRFGTQSPQFRRMVSDLIALYERWGKLDGAAGLHDLLPADDPRHSDEPQ